MNYFRALALISHVGHVLAAIDAYKAHKRPSRLAGQLSAALLSALHSYGLAKRITPSQATEIVEAIEVVLDIVEER